MYEVFGIIHSRSTANDFNHVIEKVNNRLAGWRLTSLKSVVAALPMCMKFPLKICKMIDKCSRNFFCGELLPLEDRSIWLDGINTITISIDQGRLGIHNKPDILKMASCCTS